MRKATQQRLKGGPSVSGARGGRLNASLVLLVVGSFLSVGPVATAAPIPEATPMCRPSRDVPERNRQTGSGVPTESDTVQETLIVGDTVYFVGPFTHVADSDGDNKQARSKVAACSIATGKVLPFTADTNGYMNRALAHDGSRLFIAGEFTEVNGVARPGLAAVDPVTGAVLP